MTFVVLFLCIYYNFIIQIFYYIYADGVIPDSLFSLFGPLFCISNKAIVLHCIVYHAYCCHSVTLKFMLL